MMSKHAYLIVANSNFSVLEICLKMIDDERNDIFLLFDKKSRVDSNTINRLSEACEKSHISFMERIVNGGGYSQISAVLELISLANKSGNEYQYIHFFQGSDLPIKSQDDIHSFFNNSNKQFVMIEKDRHPMAVQKTKYRHFFCHNRYFAKTNLWSV